MKISELWQTYQGYTKDLTDHARKLGFAGAAICWFFKTPEVTFPPMIYWALISLVGYFIADILQSLSGALVTKRFTEKKEFEMLQKTQTVDGDVEKPRWLDWPAYTLFLVKTLLLLIGFLFIGGELVWRLAHPNS